VKIEIASLKGICRGERRDKTGGKDVYRAPLKGTRKGGSVVPSGGPAVNARKNHSCIEKGGKRV